MLFRSLISLALFALIAQSGRTQDLKGFAFKVNAVYLSSPRLNSILNRVNSERSGTEGGFFMSGLDTYYRNRRAIMMISAHGGTPMQYPANSPVRSFVWMANSSFGWILLDRTTTWMYPSVGLGANGLTLKRYHESQTELSEHFCAPSLDLSLHFDHLVTNRYQPNNNFDGILLGVRFGYTATVLQKNWPIDINDRSQVMRPQDFKGWYVTLSFGGLGFLRRGQGHALRPQ